METKEDIQRKLWFAKTFRSSKTPEEKTFWAEVKKAAKKLAPGLSSDAWLLAGTELYDYDATVENTSKEYAENAIRFAALL